MSTGDPQGSVEFEPVPLGPRRRRVDPVLIGVVIVVIGLGAAIVKPWDAPSGRPAGRADAGPSGPLPSAAATGGVAPAGPAPVATIIRIMDAERLHDAWGVRAIVQPSAGEGSRAEERWVPVPVPDGAAADRGATIGSRDEPILAIGVTTPLLDTPLDTRVSRATSDGGWEWLDVGSVDSVPIAGQTLFWPPSTDGQRPGTWPAGRYRVDLLMGTRIEHVDVAIPGRFERVPAPKPVTPSSGPLFAAAGIVPARLPAGPFAIADGVPTGLVPHRIAAVDAATAWLDPPLGSETGPFGGLSEWLPRATGLGVILPAGRRPLTADLQRLSPGPLPDVPNAVIRERAGPDGSSWYALFAAPPGVEWSPGDYAIHVTWGDAAGKHAATWRIELRPGPTSEPAMLLEVARSFARFAGSTKVVIGTDGSAPDRLSGTSCDQPDDTAQPVALAISHPGAVHVTEVIVRLLFASGRTVDVPVRVVPDVVAGMTLVAPASGVTFAPGRYRVLVESGSKERRFNICLGAGPFDG